MTALESLTLAASFLYPEVCLGCGHFTPHEQLQIHIFDQWLQANTSKDSYSPNYAGSA